MRTQFGEQLRYQDRVSTKPATLPVHVRALRQHVRLGMDITEEDPTLLDYLREATQAVEQDSGRALVCQTRKLYLDQFPSLSPNTSTGPAADIELRGCPVIGVDSIAYTDDAGAVQTWSAASYQVNAADEPARVRYVWGGYYPSARQQEKSICVTYKAGYVIPFSVVASTNVLTLRGITPTNGDVYRVSNSGGDLPTGLETGADYHVIDASGATCKLSLSAGGAAVDITSAGLGLQFLGELNPLATMAIYLRVAMSYADREGAEYDQCFRGYWSKIYGLRYEGA